MQGRRKQILSGQAPRVSAAQFNIEAVVASQEGGFAHWEEWKEKK